MYKKGLLFIKRKNYIFNLQIKNFIFYINKYINIINLIYCNN